MIREIVDGRKTHHPTYSKTEYLGFRCVTYIYRRSEFLSKMQVFAQDTFTVILYFDSFVCKVWA